MRQVNFIVLFFVCLAVALFAMQNATTVTVQLWPGLTFESPLVVELLLAGGFGASVAWLFGVWSKTQAQLEMRQKDQELKARESRITELKEMVVELEATKQLPPSKRAEPQMLESETIDAQSEAQAEADRIRAAEAEAAKRVLS